MCRCLVQYYCACNPLCGLHFSKSFLGRWLPSSIDFLVYIIQQIADHTSQLSDRLVAARTNF